MLRIVYPKPISAELFMRPEGRRRSIGATRSLLVSRHPVNLRHSNSSNTLTCAIEELEMKAAGGQATDRSYTETHLELGPDAPRFFFAPGEEEVEIRWKLRNPRHVTGVTLEVRRAGSTAPVWKRQLTWSAGKCPERSKTLFDGSLAPKNWTGHTEPAIVDTRSDNALFTSDHVDIRRGPYMVRATIESTVPGAVAVVSERWVYFDVLVASFTVDWGAPGWRTPALSGVSFAYQRKHLAAEATLFDDLKNVGAPAAGTVFPVILPSNIFAKKPIASDTEVAEAKDQTDFRRYAEAWGDGPRFPLKAVVKVRSSSGAAVDAPRAIGSARVLWDWDDDKPQRYIDWIDLTQQRSLAMLNDVVTYQVAPNTAPASANCPAALGGKVGAPNAPVFAPTQAAVLLRPGITAGAQRVWAAFSRFGVGVPGDTSPTVFNPARMSGDRYRVRAILEVCDGLDTAEDITADPLVCKGAGTFVVQRQTDVRYLAMPNGNLAITPDAVKSMVRRRFREQIDLRVDFHEVAFNAVHYETALRAGMAAYFASGDTIKTFPYGHLVFEARIPWQPNAPTSLINYRSRAEFLTELEAAFKTRPLQVMRVPAPIARERITAGAKVGDILWPNDHEPANSNVRFVLVHPTSAGRFADAENVTGLQTLGAATISEVRDPETCWGETYAPPAQVNDQALDDAIRVRCSGRTALVRFRKKLGRLTTTPQPADVVTLRTEVLAAAAALAPGQPLDFSFETKVSNSARIAQRIDHIKDEIRKLFRELLIVDRKTFYDAINGYIVNDNNALRGTIPNNLNGHFIPQLAEAFAPGLPGLMMVHGQGETNTATAGYTQNAREPRSSGTFIASAFLNDRSRAVVSFGTVADDAPFAAAKATKDRAAVCVHELAHAMFLPHAASTHTDGSWPERVVEGCHVALDPCVMNYDTDSWHFCALCILRLRGWDWRHLTYDTKIAWEYNVTVELGDVDTLFRHPEQSPAGRKERLNAIGLLRRPLDHPEVDACLNFSWAYALDLFPNLATAGELNKVVADFLVDRGAIPAKGASARIKVPFYPTVYSGSDYFKSVLSVGQVDTSQYHIDDLSLQADPYDAMQLFFAANPAIGQIPLKVTVRRRPQGNQSNWDQCELAPEAAVSFSLLPADAVPSAESASPHSFPGGGVAYYRANAPPALRPTPDAWWNTKVKQYRPDEGGSGQTGNAHVDHGGKRGPAFELFYERAGDGTLRALDAHSDPDTQYTLTDANGVANVIFAPSRVAGDRYKLRVRVTRPTTESESAVAITGTMVRWRVVRVSRHLMMPSTGGLPSWVDDLPTPPNYTCTHPRNVSTASSCPQCLNRYGGTPKVDLAPAALEFARAGCLLVADKGAAAVRPLAPYNNQFRNDVATVLADVPERNDPTYAENARGITKETLVLSQDGPTRTYHRAAPTPLDYDVRLSIRKNGEGPEGSLFRYQGGAFVNTGLEGGAQITYDAPSGQIEVQIRNDAPGLPPQLCHILGRTDDYVDPSRLLDEVFPASSPALFNLRLPPSYNANPGPANNKPLAWQATAQKVAPADEFRAFVDDRGDFGLVKSTLFLTLSRSIDSNNNYMPGLMIVQAAALDNYYLLWPSGVQQGKGAAGLVLLCRPSDSLPISDKLATHELGHALYLMHGRHTQGPVTQHSAGDVCVMDYESGITQHDGDHCGQCVAALRGLASRLQHFHT